MKLQQPVTGTGRLLLCAECNQMVTLLAGRLDQDRNMQIIEGRCLNGHTFVQERPLAAQRGAASFDRPESA